MLLALSSNSYNNNRMSEEGEGPYEEQNNGPMEEECITKVRAELYNRIDTHIQALEHFFNRLRDIVV